MISTLTELLAAGAPGHPAIGAPGRVSLTFQQLRELAARVGATLNAAGLGPGDCIAIVMPNGAEAATAFLTIACHAIAAPLNPGYQAREFAFYLSDLQPGALVVQAGTESVARAVAADQGIPVIELVPDLSAAGAFTLILPADLDGTPAVSDPVGPDDVALLLHTSGTTARPKIVPLSQRNLCASAHNIRATLRLAPDDICLNIMPLFHIHGLIAAVLSSVAAGACVVCTPGLSAFRFFTWLNEIRPTWYTAVPTMHQALLDIAPRFEDAISRAPLRFLRSSSASMPPALMLALEATFRVPLIEAYGMTEAAHQMASNPLPPARRPAGSVGIAAGPEVAIMDADGTLLPCGSTGEVVIRGANVMKGYANNPTANAAAFQNGWFRTGDEGVLDSDGYLRLTGRLKEIINRAGEKIAPIEIDHILMEHPAVAQAVTFAMPSLVFGEDVAAAVVLKAGVTADVATLRAWVGRQVAAFKVPKTIVILKEIPKGPTGKLQRMGLAERLGVKN